MIQGIAKKDLLGEAKPSMLFQPMVGLLSKLLRCDPKKNLSNLNIVARRILHPVIMLLVPAFMDYKQVFESKNALLGIDVPDKRRELPGEPVIWCVNHGFKDDIAASIHATRHSYMFFGSLPHFFNTFDGVALFLNGVILCNRKNREMKKAAFELAVQSLKKGNDLTILPEGVWNKTPEKLVLDLWPGIYRIAKETGSKVIPIIHYLADPHKKYKGNVIHTVVADPISMDGLSEKEGLELLRDTMATWYFLMMERYGQTTRQELLDGFETADDAWESYISMHTGCQKYYDQEIELCADYRLKQIVRPEDVWQSVANIQNIHIGNITHVRYAKELTFQERKRDFQRRF
jgi:1-acyl-sn-glycerol-3-phosphate acyltransferase